MLRDEFQLSKLSVWLVYGGLLRSCVITCTPRALYRVLARPITLFWLADEVELELGVSTMMVALNARQSFGTCRNPSYPFLQCSAIRVQAPWIVAAMYVGSTRSCTQFEINSGHYHSEGHNLLVSVTRLARYSFGNKNRQYFPFDSQQLPQGRNASFRPRIPRCEQWFEQCPSC